MAQLHKPVTEVKLPPMKPTTTLHEAMRQFEGCPNTPQLRVHVQHTVEQWFLSRRTAVPEFALATEGTTLAINFAPKLPMSIDEFTDCVGRPPTDDDLDRVNCPTIGGFGHTLCGWCVQHNGPRFQCGCLPKGPTHG